MDRVFSKKTIASGLWAIPIVFLIRLIRPIILIRVGTFLSSRAGHFVADAAYQWIVNETKTKAKTFVIDLYWLDDWTCNVQWAKMVKRNLNVYRFVKYIYIWNNFIPGGSRNINVHGDSSSGSRDIGLTVGCNTERHMMSFFSEEEEEAKRWLRSKGWSDGQKFVCVLVRDDAYLDSEDKYLEYDWNYHDYRDSDILTYVPAMEWLADQGLIVLRMGKRMKKKVNSNHKNIIDYAFCKDRSDLLDIWLFANCNLCITTMTGLDRVSDIYNRPLMAINYLPLIDMYAWGNSLNYPKYLAWKDSNTLLTLREVLNNQYTDSDSYVNAGIDIINLSEYEITSAVQEFWHRVKGVWVETDEGIKKQKRLWDILTRNSKYMENNKYIHKNTQISSTLLFNHADFLK